jgi:hypothetical protein
MRQRGLSAGPVYRIQPAPSLISCTIPVPEPPITSSAKEASAAGGDSKRLVTRRENGSRAQPPWQRAQQHRSGQLQGPTLTALVGFTGIGLNFQLETAPPSETLSRFSRRCRLPRSRRVMAMRDGRERGDRRHRPRKQTAFRTRGPPPSGPSRPPATREGIPPNSTRNRSGHRPDGPPLCLNSLTLDSASDGRASNRLTCTTTTTATLSVVAVATPSGGLLAGEAVLDGPDRHLGTGAQAKLGEDVARVCAGRPRRDDQRLRDFAVGPARATSATTSRSRGLSAAGAVSGESGRVVLGRVLAGCR